jgi:hypothetical protein
MGPTYFLTQVHATQFVSAGDPAVTDWLEVVCPCASASESGSPKEQLQSLLSILGQCECPKNASLREKAATLFAAQKMVTGSDGQRQCPLSDEQQAAIVQLECLSPDKSMVIILGRM